MVRKLIVLACCLLLAWTVAAQDDPKIYVSPDLLGMVTGSFGGAVEIPTSGKQSIMIRAAYMDWQLGVMPEFFKWYTRFLVELTPNVDMDGSSAPGQLMNTMNNLIDNTTMKGFSAAVGSVKYSSNSGGFRPYSAGYIGYGYSKLGFAKMTISGTEIPAFSQDAHSFVLAGRFGTKAVAGFLAADLFIELSLIGMYMDKTKLLKQTGAEQLFKEMGYSALYDLYTMPLTILPALNLGLGLAIAL